MPAQVLCIDAKQTSRFMIDDRFEEAGFAYVWHEHRTDGAWVQEEPVLIHAAEFHALLAYAEKQAAVRRLN
jgi:hypothetical protein